MNSTTTELSVNPVQDRKITTPPPIHKSSRHRRLQSLRRLASQTNIRCHTTLEIDEETRELTVQPDDNTCTSNTSQPDDNKCTSNTSQPDDNKCTSNTSINSTEQKPKKRCAPSSLSFFIGLILLVCFFVGGYTLLEKHS
ncbi:3132_t:CDS:1 [Acaulospora morrowiae]|uniref:3132_t:CDS:1 n=1 Tax=Acaulospora morrowiae TaxID=94023 RepID=A0A9N9GLU9_9GLOM|nr:3132_t:CDS:1 [Acaulospora morrowiae]